VVDFLYTVDGPSTERDLKLVLALRDLCLSRPRKAKSNIPREPGIIAYCKLWEADTRTWRKVESRRWRKVSSRNARLLLPKCDFVAAPQAAIQHSSTPQPTDNPITNRLLLPGQSPYQRTEPKHIEENCDFIVAPQPATQHSTAPPLMDELLYVHNDAFLLPTQSVYKSGKPKCESGRNGSIGYPCRETKYIRHRKPFGTRLDMEAHWRKKHDVNLVAPFLYLIFNCPESNCVHHRKQFKDHMELFKHWKATYCFAGTTTEAPQSFRNVVASELGWLGDVLYSTLILKFGCE